VAHDSICPGTRGSFKTVSSPEDAEKETRTGLRYFSIQQPAGSLEHPMDNGQCSMIERVRLVGRKGSVMATNKQDFTISARPKSVFEFRVKWQKAWVTGQQGWPVNCDCYFWNGHL